MNKMRVHSYGNLNFSEAFMKIFNRSTIYAVLLVTTLCASDQPDRKIIHREEAEYPAAALQNNLHGSVKLKVWIGPDGTVRRLEYVGGHPLLATSALRAVKKWKYQPGPGESTSQVEIKF
jgi:TonB family protein